MYNKFTNMHGNINSEALEDRGKTGALKQLGSALEQSQQNHREGQQKQKRKEVDKNVGVF